MRGPNPRCPIAAQHQHAGRRLDSRCQRWTRGRSRSRLRRGCAHDAVREPEAHPAQDATGGPWFRQMLLRSVEMGTRRQGVRWGTQSCCRATRRKTRCRPMRRRARLSSSILHGQKRSGESALLSAELNIRLGKCKKDGAHNRGFRASDDVSAGRRKEGVLLVRRGRERR